MRIQTILNRVEKFKWDRSSKRRQFRSPRRQRTGWLERVHCKQRIQRRRSARCEKRGVRATRTYGVAELGTDGSARRSRLLSLAW
jgi:hypothetical protein